MKNFNFASRTKIHFGEGSISYLEKELENYGDRILLYGGGSIKKTGIYDSVIKILKKSNKKVFEVYGVMPNPTYAKVLEGTKACKENNIDLILAVGGGSVIDCAKAIAVSTYAEGDAFKRYWLNFEKVDNKTIPVASILTMAGTGSEMNGGSVITNTDLKIKAGRVFENQEPVFSILDPVYTYTVPKYQMLSGIFDIMSHLMETYFSGDDDNVSDDDLIQIIKGPDFPTGGLILGLEGIKDAYKTGRGKITMRAEAEIEEMSGNKQRIIVSSLPYQVNKAKLIENIADLVKDKRIEGISEIRDESDRESKVRIVIELKRDVNAQVILNQLYKHTQLQDTFGVIMLALVNGEPKILTLRQCLDHYIDHRKVVILRRTQFDLDKALARAHILEGLKIALDNIDEVINIIRSSYDDPKERLMKRFNLSDIQAQAILDMRLKTLSGLQREKIDEEYNELMKLIEHLRAILSSERLVYDIIKEELLEIKQKYGDERKTKIVAAEGEINIEDLVKEEQTVITLTHFGYVKRMPIDTYKSQKRGGKGITGLATREEDFVKQIFTASTHDTLLFFSNKGKLYRLRGYEIPEAGRTAKGTAIVNLLRLDPGEKISAVIPISNFADGKYLLMGTKQGFIKKTPLNEFDSSRKTGLLSITLREDDELIDVRLTDGQDNVVLVTSQGACITFSEKDVRPMGRTAQGVIGIRLDSEDCVIGMESIVEGNKNATLLAITENGFGKRTELDEYRVQTRGGKGVTTYKITPKTGSLIGIRIATDNEDVMLITDNGTIIRLKVKDISILGRSTQGVTLMRTNEGKVVSIETINPDENEGDE